MLERNMLAEMELGTDIEFYGACVAEKKKSRHKINDTYYV